MRSALRLLIAVLVAAAPVALGVPSCGTDAQNIQACREVESARCDLAPACSPGFDVGACKRFYRDACLVGTSSTDADAGSNEAIASCVAALQACGTSDAGTGCPGQALREGASCQVLNDSDAGSRYLTVDPTPCNIIMHCPELLQACAWVGNVQPPVTDAGTDAEAGTGGTGGSSSSSSSTSTTSASSSTSTAGGGTGGTGGSTSTGGKGGAGGA